MNTRTGILIAAVCLGGFAPAGRAADLPTTQPAAAARAESEVRDLIAKLGDADAGARNEATAKLAAMGKSALPQLKALEDSDDPELRGRVRALVRRAERRLPPAAPATDKRFHTQSMKVSVREGVRTIDVNDNGYQVRIERAGKANDERIKMSVTGIEEGKEVTEVYEAKDADELKRDNPEAFAIYERWGGGAGGPGVNIRFGVVAGGGGGGAGAVGAAGAGGADAIERAREMLRRQIAEGNLPAEQQLMIQEHINRLDEMQREVDKRRKEIEGRVPPGPPAPPAPPEADGPPGAPPVPPGE